MPEVRLQKIIADAGLASRREAERLIEAGEVQVNGRVVRELGAKADPERDHVKVRGRLVPRPAPKVFFALHKPPGVVTTMRDPEGRPTVADLLTGIRPRVYPVGRLDWDAEGLLLVTNDGDLAARLAHPRSHVPKTYEVKVKGIPTRAALEALAAGPMLDDGPTRPAFVRFLRRAEQNAWIELTIREGRNHQVKRMCEAVGHPALKIRRVRFDGIALGDLPRGRYRALSDAEVRALRAAVAKAADAAAAESKDARRARPRRAARDRL
ncbi:MAG TPA: pseudouridine synthase [Thermodesulfobacteriota bacterium]